MYFNRLYVLALASVLALSCGEEHTGDNASAKTTKIAAKVAGEKVDQFADIKVLRYDIPGFEDLTLKEQKLVYYMTQAGLAGRDIMWAQNYRHNLEIRNALEIIYEDYKGAKDTEEWEQFVTYTKRVWFANGIHHHYSNAKMKPAFSAGYLKTLLTDTGAKLEGEAFEVLFNDMDAKKVNLSKDADIVLESAINFYGPDVTTQDVEDFYEKIKVDPKEPIEVGLNTRLV